MFDIIVDKKQDNDNPLIHDILLPLAIIMPLTYAEKISNGL